jgi:hypothetical protein
VHENCAPCSVSCFHSLSHDSFPALQYPSS